jgi:peptidoglycan/LPS O-acetylase OafA/YrhL
VLFTHCFALVSGTDESEPLRSLIDMTPGTIAVDLFFATSGFLVTSSLLSRRNAIEFVAARILRIYPALIVMVLVTIFCVGVYFTTVSLDEYFGSRDTLLFLVKNVTVIRGTHNLLPGVFADVPYATAINSSLWTLTYEVKLYCVLVLMWLVSRVASSNLERRSVALIRIVKFVAGIAFVLFLANHFYLEIDREDFRLVWMFFCGAALYAGKDTVQLSSTYALACLVALFIALINPAVFIVVYYLVVGYIVLWFAYVPKGWLRHFNRFGDYSYGIYIYSFVVQQSIISLKPTISVFELFIGSSAVTLLISILSWHWIEKPALALKGHCVEWFREVC